MENNETTYGPAIAVAIIIVILFFGGWYVFIGQNLTGPTSETPIMPEISTSSNPIVYGTSTQNLKNASTSTETATN